MHPAHQTHTLTDGQLLALPVAAGQYRITCLSGILWVTRRDDSVDHVLHINRFFNTAADRDVVIQALEDSQVQVEMTEPAE